MKAQQTLNSLFIAATIAALLLALGSTVNASPFAAKRIPAQADAVAHVDMDKLRASNVWKSILAQLPKEAQAGAKKDVGQQILKALKTLDEDGMMAVAGSIMASTRGLTVWGDDKDQWALLVDLPNASSLMALAKGTSKAKTSIKKGVMLFQLDDNAFLAVHGNTLIVSEHADAVVTTARVLKGQGKSLAARKLGKLNASSKKGILFVAGFGGKLLETFKKSAASAALQADIRSVVLYVGEHGGSYFAEAEAQLTSNEEATNLASVATGLLGLASLGNDDPDLAAMLKSLSIKAKGSVLQARIEIAGTTIHKMIADQKTP